jgi:hypothetical protein
VQWLLGRVPEQGMTTFKYPAFFSIISSTNQSLDQSQESSRKFLPFLCRQA